MDRTGVRRMPRHSVPAVATLSTLAERGHDPTGMISGDGGQVSPLFDGPNGGFTHRQTVLARLKLAMVAAAAAEGCVSGRRFAVLGIDNGSRGNSRRYALPGSPRYLVGWQS